MPAPSLTETDVANAWNGNAERWTQDVRAGYDAYRDFYTLPAFFKFMPPVAGRTVIDLGCGEGSNTRRFAELGGRMTGVDIAAAMIARAREEEARAPLGIRYEVGSFAQLDGFSDGSFDAAVSTMALMDGPDFAGAMRAAYRVLAPDGTLCFSILHPCFFTPVFDWVPSDDGGWRGLTVGRYFETVPYFEEWRFSRRPDPQSVAPFRVPRFPQTLSGYLNAVCAAGFRITAVAEPRPEEAVVRDHPYFARWREHVPLALFISAVRA